MTDLEREVHVQLVLTAGYEDDEGPSVHYQRMSDTAENIDRIKVYAKARLLSGATFVRIERIRTTTETEEIPLDGVEDAEARLGVQVVAP